LAVQYLIGIGYWTKSWYGEALECTDSNKFANKGKTRKKEKEKKKMRKEKEEKIDKRKKSCSVVGGSQHQQVDRCNNIA
jgi:hypothetical protein